MQAYLIADLYEANIGNIDSPIKAACDVMRDLRDNLRAAIDFGGLKEASHRWLFSAFVPVMNRTAVGPPKERIEEMLALIDAGVLVMDWGPGAECQRSNTDQRLYVISTYWKNEKQPADVLVHARVSMHSPKEDASPLIQDILKNGYARLFYNEKFHPGGIEINRNFNLINQQGETLETVWTLGMLTEGGKFYTFVVPRPGVNSTAVVDSGRCVEKMISMIRKNCAAIKASQQ